MSMIDFTNTEMAVAVIFTLIIMFNVMLSHTKNPEIDTVNNGCI